MIFCICFGMRRSSLVEQFGDVEEMPYCEGIVFPVLILRDLQNRDKRIQRVECFHAPNLESILGMSNLFLRNRSLGKNLIQDHGHRAQRQCENDYGEDWVA